MSNDMNKKKKKQLIMKLKEEIAGELGLNDNIAKKVGLILRQEKLEKLGLCC